MLREFFTNFFEQIFLECLTAESFLVTAKTLLALLLLVPFENFFEKVFFSILMSHYRKSILRYETDRIAVGII